MGNKLYVANLSFGASEDHVRDLFHDFGEVMSLRLIPNDRGQGHKGFGFVELESDEAAKNAIGDLNGADFMGRPLVVDYARERAPRPAGQNRGYGDRGGYPDRGGYGGGGDRASGGGGSGYSRY